MNRIKHLIGEILGFNQQITRLNTDYTILLNRLHTKDTEIEKILKQKQKLEEQIIILEKELQQKQEYQELEQYWNNKYPTANVSYLGRTWGTSTTRIRIDVKLFIQPQDFHIHEILHFRNLYYKIGEDQDKHIIKIYHFIKNNYYKYVYDHINYGINEYWEFPFEILEGLNNHLTTGYDCDSWANFIASFLIASGIPEWKVRVVVGTSQLGGHSTIYAHSNKTNKFHHINSTYGTGTNQTELHKYPTTDDAYTTDKIGIKNVWFSFNNLHSWNKFTSQSKTTFIKEKAKQQYEIK